jgi:hypothetical protein
MIRFPDQHFSAACQCNLATSNPSELARKVAEVYLGKEMKPVEMPVGGEKGVQVSEEQLKPRVGTYLNPRWRRDAKDHSERRKAANGIGRVR